MQKREEKRCIGEEFEEREREGGKDGGRRRSWKASTEVPINSLYLTHLIDCIQGTQLDDQSCHTPQLVTTQEI